MLRKAKTLWERPWAFGTIVWTRIESRQYIGWWRGCHPRHPHVVFLYWRNAPSAPQISLPSQNGHISPSVVISIVLFKDFSSLHFGDCSSGTPFSLRWSAMEYRRCQPPCSRVIMSLRRWRVSRRVYKKLTQNPWHSLIAEILPRKCNTVVLDYFNTRAYSLVSQQNYCKSLNIWNVIRGTMP